MKKALKNKQKNFELTTLGFTLIELLAVIIILAIIAVIIYASLGDVIHSAKGKTFETSVGGLENAAKLNYQKEGFDGTMEYKYENGNLILSSVNGEPKEDMLKIEGLIENGQGTICINEDGDSVINIWNDEWCATKNSSDKFINFEEKNEKNCIKPQSFTEIMSHSNEVLAQDPEKNLRYVGPTPNNYVLFNNELWRIIGIFNGQTKIIKSGIYSTEDETKFSYDDNNLNDWQTASLQVTLNTTYLNSIEETSKNYIDLQHEWNIGKDVGIYKKAIRSHYYYAERSDLGYLDRPNIWVGAIGLMYASDYGYSSNSDSEDCDKPLYAWCSKSYSSGCIEGCFKESWLYDDSNDFWLMNVYSGSGTQGGYGLASVGFVGYANANEKNAIVPTLYLKSNVDVVGGTGSVDDPFKLHINECAKTKK